MLRKLFSALPFGVKALLLVSILGVLMSAALAVTARYYKHEADANGQLAMQLRAEGTVAMDDARAKLAMAADLQAKFDRANSKVAKLQAELEKIKVPDKPGPAPEEKKRLVSDLQAMGLELVVKPSTTISPSLVGITLGDGKTIWGWGMENLRVPALEDKITALTLYSSQVIKARDLAEKVASARTQQADAAMLSADRFQGEADVQRDIANNLKKAYLVERKKRLLYTGGALLGGYLIHKELVK